MTQIKVIGTLVGNIERDPFARVKYGFLFDELRHVVDLQAVLDATLRGPQRWINGLQTFHWDRSLWRERFYKNIQAFNLRSRNICRQLDSWQYKGDVCLQLGVLFNSRAYQSVLPVVIYTDYTQVLSSQAAQKWRSPFNQAQRKAWIEAEANAYLQAAHVCTRSRQTYQSIVADYGIDSKKVSVIGGGVNFATLPDLTQNRANDNLNLLFIGKEFERKGGDLVLAAFQLARQYYPNLMLTIVTSGPIPVGLSLEGVTIYQPSWDRDWIGSLYRNADIFVLPSRLETWGDVILEAMAYGLPCLGVKGQAMDELIDHGKTGLLVDPNDIDALTQGIIILASNPELRITMSQQARVSVERSYTWRAVSERLAAVFNEVCQ